nr:hypothetical protein MFLOJ_05650 [Mycobacterium florentinum]
MQRTSVRAATIGGPDRRRTPQRHDWKSAALGYLNALGVLAKPADAVPAPRARGAERLAAENALANTRTARTHMMPTRGRHVV